jgi:DNA-binding NarL/FixJ family response regulator
VGRVMTKDVDILIADDHELVRKGLISILTRRHPEWRVVADVSNGLDAIECGESLRPDIAILDLSMPRCGGLQVAERLLTSVPGIGILILTMHAAAPILHQLQKAGVSAYLAKNEAPTTLVMAVERILAGEPFFASGITTRVAAAVREPEYIPARFLLTARELDVMRMLALGKGNKEVASELNMSVRTAENHRASVQMKLNVQSPGEIVRIAIRDGLI